MENPSAHIVRNVGTGAGALAAGILLLLKDNTGLVVTDATLSLLPLGLAWALNQIIGMFKGGE